MAVGEDTGSDLGFVEPELTADITLIEIDSGNDPLLAKVADALFRWRFGIVVLSPVFIAVMAFTVLGQQSSPDPTTIEADRASSALEPLIEGVAGPSSRTGAAPAISGGPNTSSSTIDVATSTDADSASGRDATSRSSSSTSSNGPQSTQFEMVAGPTTSLAGPLGPSTSQLASSTTTTSSATTSTTTQTTPTTTSTVGQTTTTDSESTTTTSTSPVTTGLVSCTVLIDETGADLRVSPNDSSEYLLHIPVGTYDVITTSGEPEPTWYNIKVAGTLGWVEVDDVADHSYTCT
ncbi:MAG: hypothetical protein GY724_13165 [Actinomycetia bacterium]|nr:hypothetical protein [Actinomycetes bacterium]